MNYLIGDVQGCCDALNHLLTHINFSPSRDHLYFLGDLINRGPQSLRTLKRLQSLQGASTCLLGNHDLHFLAVAHGSRKTHRSDTLDELLTAPECPALINWLRAQKLAVFEHGWLMVHAGVVPQWSLTDTLTLAEEVEQCLSGPDFIDFLHVMYSDYPSQWSADLTGFEKWRFVVNVLTRIRYCTPDGILEMQLKDDQTPVPPGLCRWFDTPERRTASTPIAFGHWSTLGLIQRPDLLALDTGCVWGGKLSAACLVNGKSEIFQIPCQAAQQPD